MMKNNEDQRLNVIIVEDELHSRESLRNLLHDYCPGTNVLAMSENIEKGLADIRMNKPDLLFLDIEMPGGSGFTLLERLRRFDFEVIFTTAFEHYAIKAIKFSALDYLLKPIDVDELVEAVEKVRQKKERAVENLKLRTLLENLNLNKGDHIITLATAEGLEFIKVSDIFYCEADGSYTKFYLKNNGKLMVSKNLKEYENLLSDYGFYRTHNSYLVNLSEVKRYIKGDGGHLIMNNGDAVSISSRRKEALIHLFPRS